MNVLSENGVMFGCTYFLRWKNKVTLTKTIWSAEHFGFQNVGACACVNMHKYIICKCLLFGTMHLYSCIVTEKY